MRCINLLLPFYLIVALCYDGRNYRPKHVVENVMNKRTHNNLQCYINREIQLGNIFLPLSCAHTFTHHTHTQQCTDISNIELSSAYHEAGSHLSNNLMQCHYCVLRPFTDLTLISYSATTSHHSYKTQFPLRRDAYRRTLTKEPKCSFFYLRQASLPHPHCNSYN